MKPIGLTQQFYNTTKCDNCGMVIMLRKDSKKLAYSKNGKRSSGFFCLQCAIRRGNVTEEEVAKFTSSLG